MMQQRRKKEQGATRASSKERQPFPSSELDGGGMDLPQGFADETPLSSKRPARRRRKHDSGGNGWIFGFVFLLIIVLVASYNLVAHHEEKKLNHLREEIVHNQVEPLSQEWEGKFAELLEENTKLVTGAEQFKEDNERIKGQLLEKEKELVTEDEQYSTLKEDNARIKEQQSQATELRKNLDKRVDYLAEYKKTIQRSIQEEHKVVLLEKFGPGPHHVEINLQFDPAFPKAKDTDTDEGRMVIVLAAVDEMPHTVYFFLEHVSHKLYDGTSFHRNAGHVMQGGPSPNFLTKPGDRVIERFEESGFASVLFQEYSPKSPHEKYTLGMAGRPGGPDFYVSTRNNTDLHGPGGQRNYADPSEADPCFAKIIKGTEFVDRMQLGPVKPGGYKALKHNVAITSMRILPSAEPKKKKGLVEKEPEVQEKETDPPERTEKDDDSVPDVPETATGSPEETDSPEEI